MRGSSLIVSNPQGNYHKRGFIALIKALNLEGTQALTETSPNCVFTIAGKSQTIHFEHDGRVPSAAIGRFANVFEELGIESDNFLEKPKLTSSRRT